MKPVFALLLCSLSLGADAQTGASFDEIKAAGVRVTYLDSAYKSAIHTNRKLAAFPKQQDKVQFAFIEMLSNLATYLDKNGFKWGEPAHCFNRVYFNKDGRIDYFLYNFRGSIPAEKEATFKKLLNEFIANYNFGMTNKVNFVQCGPVTYQDE